MKHIEPMNGGLVQTRHATLLKPGELQQADDTILRPGDPALYKAPGRTSFGTVLSVNVTCTTNGTTTLTSSSAFGTNITSVVVTAGSPNVTKASAFAAVLVGQTVVGTGIPVGTVVLRRVSTSELELSNLVTASGTVTITHSNHAPGTFISDNGQSIFAGTYIVSITNASTLIMSNVSFNNGTLSRQFTEGVTGLRYLSFDSGQSSVLLAKVADRIYTAPLTGTTGTFAILTYGLSRNVESMLQSIQFKNRHIVLTGYDPPRLVYYGDDGAGTQTIRERALGMLPVTNFIGPTIVPGVWSTGADFGVGYYYFLVTEVTVFGDEEVEGTFVGTPLSVHITDPAAEAVYVAYQAAASQPVNDGNYGRNTATHWRIYMAPRQVEEFPTPDLSTFVTMATVPISSTATTLSEANTFQFGYSAALGALIADPLFPAGSANALSGVTKQTLTATTTLNSRTLTSAAAFGTVVPGMVVVSTNNRIPAGTIVISKESSSSLTMSARATAAGTETVGFGNKSSFDNLYAICPKKTTAFERQELFQNFGLHNIGTFSTATIRGIKVDIVGRLHSDSARDYGLSVRVNQGGGGGSFSSSRQGTFWPQRRFGSAAVNSLLSFGGIHDTWGLSWVPADFIDGGSSFGVAIRKLDNPDATFANHQIDGVRVTVYGGTTKLNLDGTRFRTITVSDQLGVSFSSGAAGPPPIATTGDVFDGMVLLNDTGAESTIVASLPDDAEAYPDVYRLPLRSKEDDRIRVIRKVANVAVVGCAGNIKRLNYFPRETDADSNQGRAYETIASDHGMVGPRAAQLIDLPNVGSVLVYLSHTGLRWTDGVTTHFLNDDIAWDTLFSNTYIQRSVLQVYPHLSIIALYYVPAGSSVGYKTKALYFSYHPAHMKEGNKLPALGPIAVLGESAASALVTGRHYLYTGHARDGKVYLEDSGLTDGSGGSIAPIIRSRRFFAREIGEEGRIERIFMVAGATGGGGPGTITVDLYGQNQDEAVTLLDTVNPSLAQEGIKTLFLDNILEMFDVIVRQDGGISAAMRLHYWGYENEDYSQDQSRGAPPGGN